MFFVFAANKANAKAGHPAEPGSGCSYSPLCGSVGCPALFMYFVPGFVSLLYHAVFHAAFQVRSNIFLHQSDQARAGFLRCPGDVRRDVQAVVVRHEAEEKDSDSLLWFYRKMVAVRRREDLEETFLYGTLIPEYETVSGVLAYRRKDEKNNILILTTSLADGVALPFADTIEEVLLNNYDTCEAGEETIRLQPYQCLVLKVNK